LNIKCMVHTVITCKLCLRLAGDQKEKLKKEFKALIDQSKKKYGLEQAVKDLIKNPSEGVPQEMRVPEPILARNVMNQSLSQSVAVGYDELQGRHVVAAQEWNFGHKSICLTHSKTRTQSIFGCQTCCREGLASLTRIIF
jgi:hypothetical protein